MPPILGDPFVALSADGASATEGPYPYTTWSYTLNSTYSAVGNRYTMILHTYTAQQAHAITSVTDDAGNSWVELPFDELIHGPVPFVPFGVASSRLCKAWGCYVENTMAAGTTIHVTFDGSQTVVGMFIAVYGGLLLNTVRHGAFTWRDDATDVATPSTSPTYVGNHIRYTDTIGGGELSYTAGASVERYHVALADCSVSGSFDAGSFYDNLVTSPDMATTGTGEAMNGYPGIGTLGEYALLPGNGATTLFDPGIFKLGALHPITNTYKTCRWHIMETTQQDLAPTRLVSLASTRFHAAT